MADFISFDEGEDYVLNNDISGATFYVLLSSRSCPADINSPVAGEHGGGDTLATGVGEVTYWTGGARQSQVVPAPSAGVIDFATETWATGAQTDGPASVKSVVMVTSSDNTGKAICAWNLQTGGAARAFNVATTTLDFTPDYFLANVDET
jgi:hypothetical protein